MRKAILLCLIGTLMLSAVIFTAIPRAFAQSTAAVNVSLAPTDFAAAAGLSAITGSAHIVSEAGYLHVVLQPNGTLLPANTVLEGWLVDAGLDGGPGVSNANVADEGFGVAFASDAISATFARTPYALSVGVLAPTDSGTWELVYRLPNANFSPYDAVVITAESDGNALTGYDPRPGTPVFAGNIAEGTSTDAPLLEVSAPAELGSGLQITLNNAAPQSPLGAFTGSVNLYSDSGTFELTLNSNGAVLPAGTVLEAWLVDAGLETNGPGVSNASDADEVFGTPFGNADFDRLTETNFYALSVGVAAPQTDGTYRLTFSLPNGNFSPYDAILVSAESDGNALTGYDPRPGSPLLLGLRVQGVALAPAEMMIEGPSWQKIPLRNALTGEVFTLADLSAAGLTVMVEPMATWCSNCRVQQGIVRTVIQNLDPTQYVFISLSVETDLDDATLAQYAANQGYGWTFAVASDELLGELVNQFGRSVANPPSTPHFLVRPDGSFSDLKTGITREAELTAFITGQ